MPEEQRAQVEAALEQLGDLGDAEIPVDVWIDGDDLPRRMRMDMGGAVRGPRRARTASMTMTMEFFDYGEPVDIEVPSADEVTPFTEVMGGLRRRLRSGVVNERTVEVAGFGGPVVDRARRGGRRRAAAAAACTASPAPRRTSPTTSTRWPSWAGTRWRPTSAATARSDQPADEAAYTFEAFATDLLGLLDALGWERCVALGHSMGGMVVQTAILAAPERFDGLILMDTSHRGLRADPELVELGVAHRPHRGHRRRDGGPGRARPPTSPSAPARTSGSLETREGYKEFGDRKMLASSRGHVRRHAPDHHRRPSGIDRLPDLPRIAVPTLVLVGEEDAPFRKPSQRMAEAIPGAELVVLPDGGHSPAVREPRAVVEGAERLPRPRLSRPTGPSRGSARSRRSPG